MPDTNPVFSLLKRRLINATQYSLAGFRRVWQEEAWRVELTLCAVLLPVAFLLARTGVELALLVSALALVLIAELLNTAIEVVVNRISEQRHPLSKDAKDLGSAAVMVSLICAGAIWGAVLIYR